MSTRMENCHSRLVKIRDELKTKDLHSDESKGMLKIAERIVVVSSQMIKELNSETTWSPEDRRGFKLFLMECENFIKLNIELLLPRHI